MFIDLLGIDIATKPKNARMAWAVVTKQEMYSPC